MQAWLPTRADCDGLHKLLPPAVGPNHQGQVGLLQEFVHSALKHSRTIMHSPNTEGFHGNSPNPASGRTSSWFGTWSDDLRTVYKPDNKFID